MTVPATLTRLRDAGRDIERLEGELAEVRVRMKAYLKELGL